MVAPLLRVTAQVVMYPVCSNRVPHKAPFMAAPLPYPNRPGPLYVLSECSEFR